MIPAIVISGFLAFVSKNPIRFSDGSMSKKLMSGDGVSYFEFSSDG